METVPGYKEKAGFGGEVTGTSRLSSSEIGELWNTYMAFSMYACIYKYFLSNAEDNDIRKILNSALDSANKRVDWVMKTFNKEGLPIPYGYSEDDVNSSAPRLYSDPCYLHFLVKKTRTGIVLQGLALTSSARADVREFYEDCCSSTIQLYQRAVSLLISKGLYINSPHITTLTTTDYVKQKSFLAGYFTDHKRPLLAKEISSLFQGVSACNFAKVILASFRQTAKSKQVRDYMDKGVDLMNKGADTFSSALTQENIPVPMVWETFVTDSTVPPFSDKLMTAKSIYMSETGIILSGEAIAKNLRHDLLTAYTRVMTEVGNFAEEGVNIMIENGWFEEPPRVVDREELTNQKH